MYTYPTYVWGRSFSFISDTSRKRDMVSDDGDYLRALITKSFMESGYRVHDARCECE